MTTQDRLSDTELFERYVGQPASLPEGLSKPVEVALGERIVAYALADLDSELRFAEQWLVLGATRGAVITNAREVKTFSRSEITAVSIEPGLSCRVLRMHGTAERAAAAPSCTSRSVRSAPWRA